MNRIARIWAAVLVDGQPRAVVRDLAPNEKVNPDDPEVRLWRWALLDPGETRTADPDEYCVGGIPCVPGAPCRNCVATAARWWYEWQDRTDARKWRATNAVPDQSHWSAKEWCAHDKDGHADEAGARRCAKRNGFARIVEMDGHGNRLRWLPLVEPPSAAPLFVNP